MQAMAIGLIFTDNRNRANQNTDCTLYIYYIVVAVLWSIACKGMENHCKHLSTYSVLVVVATAILTLC